jgi:subtilase family serine protease
MKMTGTVCKFVSRLSAILSAAVCFSFATTSVWAQQNYVLAHHVPQAVANGQARLMDLLPGTQRLKLAINLPLRNQADLDDLLQRLYDPQSPDYHRYLSVQEFTEKFGPTQKDYDAVVSFAKANGLTVTGTTPNRRLVDVEGSVANINKAFHVVMGLYPHPTESRVFYAPDREPTVDLPMQLLQITGLDNFVLPHNMLKKGNVAKTTNAIANITGSGPGNTYLPSDIRAAYYGSGSLTGAGQSIGILSFDGYLTNDVQLFYSHTGMSSSVPIHNVLVNGYNGVCSGDGAGDGACDDGEQVLDIVNAIGMAPGITQILFYEGSSDTDILNRMATDNTAKVLSCSWGWSPADGSSDDPIFQEFQAQGQTFLSASGDNGEFNSSTYDYPADTPFITQVGGTGLTTNGTGGSWASETAWSDSGGGVSQSGYAIPSYQKLTGVINSSNKGSTTLRNIPDLAAEADFDNYTCSNGSCSGGWGGTSFATPRWAGFIALVNQQSVANGNATAGFLNTNIYSLGVGSSYTSDFHDISSGSNPPSAGSGSGFPAVTGYDLVTGWGSPNGANLISALSGTASANFSLSASPNSLTINQGANGTSTITIAPQNGFTGSVSLSVSGLPSGVTASFNPSSTAGTSTLTLTASSTATKGTAAVTITGTSGSLTQTTTISLTVNASTTANFALSASPGSLTVLQGTGGTSTITVTPQNGFTGSVSLSVPGLPSGVTASFNPSSTPGTSTLTLTASSTATKGTATVTVTGTSGSLTHTATIALTVSSTSSAQLAAYNATLKAPACATVGLSCDSGPSLLLGRGTMSGGVETHHPNTIHNSCTDGNSGTFHSDESNDRIVVASTSGGALTHGQTAKISATVWAWNDGSSDALDLYYAANANSPSWIYIGTITPKTGGAQTLSTTFTLPTGSLQAVRANFRYLGSPSSCASGSYNDHDDLIFAAN